MEKFNVFTNLFKKHPSIKKVIGFSLVELMISLITISCIAAAFAPVITKKLNKSAVAVKSGNQLLSDCSKWGSDCKACYPAQCIVCTKTCRADQHLNLDSCICEACASNCIACTVKNKCDRCAAGHYLNSSSTCTKCKNVTVGSITLTNTDPAKFSNGTYAGKYVCCPEGTVASDISGNNGKTVMCTVQNAGYLDSAGIF